MGITATLSEPFYAGRGVDAPTTPPTTGPPPSSGASSELVPALYDVALDGRPYMIDDWVSVYTNHSEFSHSSTPLIRNQADGAQSPSEASINPEDLWRRSVDTWHKGAGQRYLDRVDSDPARFNTSKGVNVWDKWRLRLLPDTEAKHTSANTNLALAVVGSYLYCADGEDLLRTQDITVSSPTWTTITGTDASAISSMCTDGYTVYLANAGGVYSTTRGAAATTGTPYNALVATLLRYVKGRLMAAAANVVYNITATGAAPTALFTHPNTDFAWVDFAEGQAAIYAAGYSGDRSLIYRTAVKADGTALDIPIVAGELPGGEIVRSLRGFSGLLLIGSDKGVRLATEDSNGNLTVGSLIPTSSGVFCFEPQAQYVWYGLTNYDGTSTGLGRVDLSTFTATLTPAYATDLMATAQGSVLSVATFRGLKVFAVSGAGVYAETSALVASGTIESGQITYRLPDPKVAMFVDVRHDLIGSHQIALSADGGTFTNLGAAHTTSDASFVAGEVRAARFEVRATLSTVASVGPTIRSWTLRSYPTTSTVRKIIAPLLLAETLTLNNGSTGHCDVAEERGAVEGLCNARTLVVWQEGNTAYPVVVEDYEWRAHHQTEDGQSWNGTLVVSLKAISG